MFITDVHLMNKDIRVGIGVGEAMNRATEKTRTLEG